MSSARCPFTTTWGKIVVGHNENEPVVYATLKAP